jgi:hypothetical protein
MPYRSSGLVFMVQDPEAPQWKKKALPHTECKLGEKSDIFTSQMNVLLMVRYKVYYFLCI